jgi:hypothetical protein
MQSAESIHQKQKKSNTMSYNPNIDGSSPSSSSSSSEGAPDAPGAPSMIGDNSSSSSALVTGETVPVTNGLSLWLRADRNVTCAASVYDIYGVSRWSDFRGLPIAATQTVLQDQPRLVSNGFDGWPALQFGLGSCLVIDPADFGPESSPFSRQ